MFFFIFFSIFCAKEDQKNKIISELNRPKKGAFFNAIINNMKEHKLATTLVCTEGVFIAGFFSFFLYIWNQPNVHPITKIVLFGIPVICFSSGALFAFGISKLTQ